MPGLPKEPASAVLPGPAATAAPAARGQRGLRAGAPDTPLTAPALRSRPAPVWDSGDQDGLQCGGIPAPERRQVLLCRGQRGTVASAPQCK